MTGFVQYFNLHQRLKKKVIIITRRVNIMRKFLNILTQVWQTRASIINTDIFQNRKSYKNNLLHLIIHYQTSDINKR